MLSLPDTNNGLSQDLMKSKNITSIALVAILSALTTTTVASKDLASPSQESQEHDSGESTQFSAKLLDISGISQYLGNISEVLEQGFKIATQNRIIKPDFEAFYFKTIDEEFKPKTLRQQAAKAMAGAFSKEEKKAIMKFYTSPLGQRISIIEGKSGTIEAQESIEETVLALRKGQKKIPKSREKLLEDLDKATNSTQQTMDLSIEMATFIDKKSGKSISAKDIMTATPEFNKDEKAKILKSMKEFTIAAQLLTYESLSDEDLKDYLDFCLSPEGQKYISETSNAVSRAMLSAKNKLMEKIQDY